VNRAAVRRRCAVLAVACLALPSAVRAADEVTVPPNVQAELLARVLGYESGLLERAHDRWRILVLRKAGDAESQRATLQFLGGLAGLTVMQGLPHEELVEDFRDAASVAELCRRRSITIVYLTPGLGAEAPAIATALAGLGLLTVAAVSGHVYRGMVLGFDLVSGKKKLLLNRIQMKLQGLSFSYQVLGLAKVVP
jgi:hypothetical protein